MPAVLPVFLPVVADRRNFPRRTHRALSWMFWAILAAGAAALSAGAFWFLHPSPADLIAADWVVPAPRGDWMIVSGPARGRGDYRPIFAENLRTGAFVRLRGLRRFASTPVFSPDGLAVAWAAESALSAEAAFLPRTLSLEPRRSETVWETRDLHERPTLVFSNDASRFAVVAADRVWIYDFRSGRMICAARLAAATSSVQQPSMLASFAGPNALRIYSVRQAGPSRERAIEIRELDIPARRLVSSGSAGPFAHAFPVSIDVRREKLLVRNGPASVAVLDARTGVAIAEFSGGGTLHRAADFLADGRIALFESVSGAGAIAVMSRDGRREKEIPLGPAERAYLLGERRPGVLCVVAGSGAELVHRRGHVLLVDIGRGSVESWGNGLSPVSPYARFLSGDPGEAPAVGGLATRLFFTADGRLVELAGPGRVRRLLPMR